MAQDQAKQLLQRGIQAAQAKRPDIARDLLQQVIRLEPQNETAWLWLSGVAKDNRERLFCLKQLLAVNPQNEFALKGLRALGVDPSAESAQASSPSATVPTLSDARYAQIQPELDEFLRRYQVEPPDPLHIQWGHKRRGRYGERGAARLKRMTYGIAALVLALMVAGIAYAVTSLDILEGDDEVALALTRIPTLTPTVTLTPTLGGPTPTAFPIEMAVVATQEPVGLGQPGDPYGLASPTAIYPLVDPNVVVVVQEAVNYYSIGDYQRAATLLSGERERSDPECYASVVYYEALSWAALEDFDEANRILKQAYQREGQRGYASCQGEPLLLVGLAEVAFAQDPLSADAMNFSVQALTENPRLVAASVTKARAELAQGAVPAARATIAQALLVSPADVNLLLVAAEIEYADDQPIAALSYLGQVLYKEPALLPALKLQTQAYLSLAAQSEAGSDSQVQYYGLAVRSAQTLLQFYPGDPQGYVLLAQARMGEGNVQLAETSLARVLAVQNSLPDNARSSVEQAYRMRGLVYLAQGRFAEARSDLQQVASVSGRVDVEVVSRLADIALQQGDYVEAKNQLDTLVTYLGVDDPAYQLKRIKLLVETCTFFANDVTFGCEHEEALDLLTDEFMLRLLDPDQQADAFGYRAQALYWETLRRSAILTDEERTTAFQQALVDINRALKLRENAADHYFRGLILEQLGNSIGAYEEYQWVLYWSTLYDYPFVNDAFNRRVASLGATVETLRAEQVAAIEAALETSAPDDGEGEERPAEEPQTTAVPEEAAPSPTATPEPTRVPPTTNQLP